MKFSLDGVNVFILEKVRLMTLWNHWNQLNIWNELKSKGSSDDIMKSSLYIQIDFHLILPILKNWNLYKHIRKTQRQMLIKNPY